jgi:AcrR family transcriptional regulator
MTGLRERKKARTRASIRQHALRLVSEHGFRETTVDQIAEAAEVSPSTFFRYFPTKEDVLLADDLDELLIPAFLAQPQDLPPVAALRNAMKEALSSLTEEEREFEQNRFQLLVDTPELHTALLEDFVRSFGMMTKIIAERLGRGENDFEIRSFCGALLGSLLGVELFARDRADPEQNVWSLAERALAHFEAGLPL